MDVIKRLARVRAPGIDWLITNAAHRGLLGRRSARIRPIDRADRTESGSLYEPVQTVSAVPRGVDDPAAWIETPRQLPIEWHRLSEACVDRYSSLVVRGREAYLQSAAASLIRSGANYSAGFCRHSTFTAIVDRDIGETIDRGIAVCGCGASNWYHWLAEVLPRAMCAGRLPAKFTEWPLIVPPEAAGIPQFSESLARVAGQRPLHIVERGSVRVRDLIWIDAPSISPFNMTRGWPMPAHGFNHHQALADLSELLASLSHRSGIALPKRALLVRSDGRRNYNQGEVVSAATEFGFRPISPETLSLADQIALFRDAEFVIGPSGAAWTGLLFAKPSGRGLIWVAEQYRGFNVFANLAAQQRFDLRYLFHQQSAQTTSEGYRASYTLDVSLLRVALQKMLSE